MEGWIKLHRKLLDNPIWTCEPFTRGQAWVDLLMLANHEDGFFYLRDHKINVKRGQVGWSHLKLALRWKWSRSKVKKFINDLEKEQQVVQQQSHSTSVITLLNYENYQEKEQQVVQQKDNRKTTERQQHDTNKNDKKNKNDKNNINPPEKIPVSDKYDFIDEIISVFSNEYEIINQIPYEQISKGKERAAAGRLLSLHKKKYPEMKSEEVLESLRIYFRACCSIQDNWLQSNMSLPIIISKFNEINNKLRNGNKRTKINSGGVTDIELATILANKFGSDRK